MTTIADLAREFNAQPHEVAAFADLGADYRDDAELDADTEAMIREAWAAAPDTDADQTAPVLDANGDPVAVPPGVDVEMFRVWMAGRVPAPRCPHYIAASEARAGFTHCERCD